MQAVLDELGSLGGKPVETLTPEEARKQPTPADAVKKLLKKLGKEAPKFEGSTDDIKIDLGDHKVAARVYTPKGDGPFPVILYIHGGGWVFADLDVYDASPRTLCNAVNAIVISTHYRQAPEFKFPAAHLDVFGAYQWIMKNPLKLKYLADKIGVIGESAGGNMACAVSMMAKEAGIQRPAYQVLVYPVADLVTKDSPSYLANADAKPLNVPMMAWFGKYVLPTPDDAKNPRLSLLLAGEELKGLPPTTIITAQIDPLMTEGEKLAKALEAAGVKVNYKHYDGVTHEFFGMGAVVDKAKDAMNVAAADLKAALAH